jgi:hypothetical protein
VIAVRAARLAPPPCHRVAPIERGTAQVRDIARARHGPAVAIARGMYFRAAVLSLLGCLILLHVEGELRRAVLGAPVARVTIEPPAPAPPATRAPEPSAVHAAPADGGATHVIDIRRDELVRVLGQPTELAGAARIVPSMVDGKPNGVKLYAIRPDSPLTWIGFENGDTVRTVNGVSLAGPEPITASLARLGIADHYEIDLVRRGQPVRLVVLVQPPLTQGT